ncbi:MAG: HAMP domain-containing histidine kinase [Bacilli bacterium]|nr:HAMP domain-containing histidine kinase [Bacilli bacterium]MBN2876297.1 HAMP domain-containing histidine kinase [Bacilli bacterium]
MKHWSIKLKIIILYTFFFALLILLDFYLLKTAATKILNDQATRQIIVVVDEVSPTLQIEDDAVYVEGLDDDSDSLFSFDHDGVNFFVYQNNQVAFGNAISGFDSTDPIQLNVVHTYAANGLSWLVYDVSLPGGYVLRGLYDMSFITTSFQDIIWIAGAISPIIILLSAIGGYFIIKKSFQPIKRIYQTASQIEEEEDFTKRIPLDESKDEVHELALMVNQMLDKVEQSITREKQFSSNVSHELRTPLAVMQAQAEYMLVRAKTNSSKEEINTIINQISFMENIVTQLLEITRTKQISTSDMELIDVYDLILMTGDALSPQLEKKDIHLDIIKPNFSTKIRSNQTMMIRVFSNLITNAIKYNVENGSIEISFQAKNNDLIIDVKDTGIGISKEKIDKIFDPFYRADESRTQTDSLGLGLSLVREVVRIHGGEITVSSEEHVGTTFRVRLPLEK